MSDVTKISGDTLESKEARRKKRKAENSKRWRKRNPEKLKAYNEKRRCEYQAKLQKVSPNNRASVVQVAVDSSNNVYIKAAAASKCSGGDVVKNSPIDNVDTNIDVDEDAG